jgi:two-component system, NarL family, response regulator NreC
MAIRVILADDHSVVRYGIKAVVDRKGKDITIVGEATNGKEVLKMARSNPADVYILDISMPILNGIETADQLIKMDPKNKIIILSMHDDRTFVEKAFKCGARGYILKESDTEEVINAIREVYKNHYYLSPKILKIQETLSQKPRQGEKESDLHLTRREREILQLIAEGFSNKEIAKQLGISLNTAHHHRINLMQKLDIHKQAELVRYALKEGISHL